MKKIILTEDQKEALIYKADFCAGCGVPAGMTEDGLDSVLGAIGDKKLIAAIVNELLEARGPTEDGWGGLESPKESWLDEDWLWARISKDHAYHPLI